jgi:hypothetical protein
VIAPVAKTLPPGEVMTALNLRTFCGADHPNNPVILKRGLANKKRVRRRVLWGVKPVRLANPAVQVLSLNEK